MRYSYLLIIIAIIIAIALALLIFTVKYRLKEGTTIGDVYAYYKENGYLKECQEGNYKFSTSQLKNALKHCNEKLTPSYLENLFSHQYLHICRRKE